jgi:hypothetical protein
MTSFPSSDSNSGDDRVTVIINSSWELIWTSVPLDLGILYGSPLSLIQRHRLTLTPISVFTLETLIIFLFPAGFSVSIKADSLRGGLIGGVSGEREAIRRGQYLRTLSVLSVLGKYLTL